MKGDEYYGHAVLDGVPQFYSVSALERGDIRSGGCALKWHKRYVQGLKDAASASKSAGDAMHAELEYYYKHPGEPVMLSATAMRAMAYLPDRGPDILSEARLSSPKAPHLTADGTPLIVKVDLIHDRATNKGAEDPSEMHDPPGTIEVLDFKWKKDGSRVEYMLQPAELVKTIQMSGYGVAVGNVWPSATHVRLSHLYIPHTRGVPRKITRLHVIDDCRKNWEYVESVARVLRDVAKETNERNVPGNRHACDKYGGCDHRATCYAYAKNVEQYTTKLIFGEPEPQKDTNMGLMSTLPANLAVAVAAAQPQAQPNMQAQLLQEEAAQRAQAAQTAAGTYPGFAEAWATIERIGNVQGGQGVPALAGAAAQLKAAMGGYQIQPGSGLAGAGPLGQITIQDPAHVVQLAAELAKQQQVQQPAPTPIQYATTPATFTPPVNTAPAPVAPQQPAFSILPPDAPAPNPATAAKPVEGFTLPGAAPQPVTVTVPLQVAAPVQVEATQPKRRGRRTKAEIAAANAAAGQPNVSSPANETASAIAEVSFGADSAVFVDAIPNCEFESLHPYVDQLCAALCAKYITDPTALKDIRCASKDTPLGYGGALGALRALALECPPPDGTYYVNTSDPFANEVAQAMRTVCERTGALYVKGVR